MPSWTLTPILEAEVETMDEAVADFQKQLKDIAADPDQIRLNIATRDGDE